MTQPTRTRDQGWYWLAASVCLVSFAQLAFKFAMSRLPGEPGIASYLAIFEGAHLVPVLLPLLLGLIAYTASVFCWLLTLARLPLSLAYPSLSLSYLLVYLGATLLPAFDEPTSLARVAGVVLVVIGVILVGRQPEEGKS